MLRLLDTVADVTVAGHAVDLEGPLPVRGLYICYSGTNQDGQDSDFDQLTGFLRVSVTGGKDPDDICAVGRCQSLVSFCEAYYGRCRWDSVTGGAFQAVLPVFFGYPWDRNVLWVGANQNLVVYPPAVPVGTEVKDCSCRVYAMMGFGVARFKPKLQDQQLALGGRRVPPLYADGVGTVILSESDDTDPDSIAIFREPDRRLTWGFWGDYLSIWQTHKDTDVAPVFGDQVMDLTFGGLSYAAGVGAGSRVEIQGGAGNIWKFEYGLDFHTGDALIRSRAFCDSYLQDARARLAGGGAMQAQIGALIPGPSQVVVPGAGAVPQIFPQIPGASGGGYAPILPVQQAPILRRRRNLLVSIRR